MNPVIVQDVMDCLIAFSILGVATFVGGFILSKVLKDD